ncbi:hypothetical protein SMETH2_12640 [Serratia marcescens]|nr:hypothetical protein SMETH2_12640 [Serratia marcescens]
MALISDILRGPYGDPQPNVIITMRAKETSARVLVSNSSAAITAADGKYSMQVFPGEYEVLVSTLGKVGEIRVYPDSTDGTLNDFLITPGEDELTPAIVKTVETMRKESADSAAAAKSSENNAAKIADQLASSIDDRIVSTLWSKTHYVMPTQAAGTGWYRLGTVTTDQHGDTIVFEFHGAAGYNGNAEQAGHQRLIFRYGNRAVNTNIAGAASLTMFTTGSRPMVVNAAMMENPRNTFDIYIQLNSFVTAATYMTVDSRSPGQLAKVNILLQKAASDPVGTMGFIEYKIPTWNAKELMPDYNVVASASLNGFGRGPQHKDDLFSVENLSSINRFNSASINVPGATLGSCITMPMDGGPSCGYLAITSGRGLWVGSSNVVTNKTILWNRVWSEINTTVDANGFIKKASPIVKLFRDGTCELNDESQGVTTERVSEGVYRVSGTLGFNADAQWGGPDGGIEVPLDRNKQPLIWVDYEVEPTGDLLIKTYHRTHPAAPAFARNDILGYDEGMPIDIPEGRWVDLRVEMPAVDEAGTEEEATT